MIRAVREIKPEAFIFENVKGLTRSSFKNYFGYIKLQLEYPDLVRCAGETWPLHLSRLEQHHTSGTPPGLSYRVVWRVLNAADYGVPQRRERVVFVGFRRGPRDLLELPWPHLTHSMRSFGIKFTATIGTGTRSQWVSGSVSTQLDNGWVE